ncbi:MAG TPA: cation transporter [Acidobacteriota bacterium]|nr:cation transporter [Acidobacteriota bacterium]
MSKTMTKLTFDVTGVHCPSCKILITDILQDEGVKVSKFDIDTKKQTGVLVVDAVKPAADIIALVKSAGDYKITEK